MHPHQISYMYPMYYNSIGFKQTNDKITALENYVNSLEQKLNVLKNENEELSVMIDNMNVDDDNKTSKSKYYYDSHPNGSPKETVPVDMFPSLPKVDTNIINEKKSPKKSPKKSIKKSPKKYPKKDFRRCDSCTSWMFGDVKANKQFINKCTIAKTSCWKYDECPMYHINGVGYKVDKFADDEQIILIAEIRDIIKKNFIKKKYVKKTIKAPCYYFHNRGYCKHGNNCKFQH